MISRRAFFEGSIAATVAPAQPMPVVCVSHGSPLLAGDPSRRAELASWGARIPKPRGIVVMTPHYGMRRIEVGATAKGVALYDLPPQLAKRLPQGLKYETPPSEALAVRMAELIGAARGDRAGFDHTTWQPLMCMFPAADVPVLELAYPYLPDAQLFALGKKLAPLRDEGILFLASGGMTHNLAAMDMTSSAVPSWSSEFDAWATETIPKHDVDALIDWRNKAPSANVAHPDDGGHYRVFLVAFGVAHASSKATFPVTGFEGAMSKRGVELA